MSSQPPPDGRPEPTPEPKPPTFQPGQASLPVEPPRPPSADEDRDYPPTAAFPPVDPVNYAPPGYTPDYGAPGYGAPGYGAPGYGSPGYGPADPGAPGYGQNPPPPGYPPAAYQQPHPQPPPRRRSNAPLIAVIVAVSLLLCGGVATAGVLIGRNLTDRAKEAASGLPTTVPPLPRLPTEQPTPSPSDSTDPDEDESRSGADGSIEVTYEVTGDGPASILYVAKRGETPTRIDNVSLPWKFETTMETPALLSVVAMRLDGSEGSISCRALVDGDEVRANEADPGIIATTSCTHFAID